MAASGYFADAVARDDQGCWHPGRSCPQDHRLPDDYVLDHLCSNMGRAMWHTGEVLISSGACTKSWPRNVQELPFRSLAQRDAEGSCRRIDDAKKAR
jgi:hypothetical protein